MRYYRPDISLPLWKVTLPTSRQGLFNFFGARTVSKETVTTPTFPARERLGGNPVGLNPDLWPVCTDCGKSQSLLAQLQHHPDRLDLGRDGRMLFVFQCAHDPGMCSTWEALSGANACFVVEPEQLGSELTPTPADGPPLDNEVWITGWLEKEDGLTATECAAFQTDATFLELPESVVSKATWSTRLGGAPHWMQSADEAPSPGWRFIGQLDGTYSFLSPLTDRPKWVRVDSEEWEGRRYVAEGPNFGGGLAYLFLRDSDGPPEGCMFWQR